MLSHDSERRTAQAYAQNVYHLREINELSTDADICIQKRRIGGRSEGSRGSRHGVGRREWRGPLGHQTHDGKPFSAEKKKLILKLTLTHAECRSRDTCILICSITLLVVKASICARYWGSGFGGFFRNQNILLKGGAVQATENKCLAAFATHCAAMIFIVLSPAVVMI